MAARNPLSTAMRALFRTSNSRTTYICRPCLQQQTRSLHRGVSALPVPQPTPFVPDVSAFLTLIGRNLSAHASKFESWDSLFTLTSPQLKELGIDPPRSRRYLLRWRQKFRNGEFGPGGDFQHVTNGVAELRVVEVPSLASQEKGIKKHSSTQEEVVSTSHSPGMTKLILNVPTGSTTHVLAPGQSTRDLKKPTGFSLKNGHVIAGPYTQPVKGTNGSVATLKVVEGLWEDKRGRKVYGGERRRAETLHKMRVAARKNNER